MKIAINGNFGGFHLQDDIAQILGVNNWDESEEVRTDSRLIEWIERNKHTTSLKVVEIPDNATDWDILEYDGLEQTVCVIDGKLLYIG